MHRAFHESCCNRGGGLDLSLLRTSREILRMHAIYFFVVVVNHKTIFCLSYLLLYVATCNQEHKLFAEIIINSKETQNASNLHQTLHLLLFPLFYWPLQ